MANKGYQVETAPDGTAAARAIEAASFDVILSDIDMPGMNGIQLLERVRARDLDVPAVRLAGRGWARYAPRVQAFNLPPLPLREDEHGVVRVAGSRVTLESVVTLFDRGATAEEIAQSFPSLSLGDVYAVLSYVVARRADVETYLARRHHEEDAAQEDAERRSPWADFRARLVARQRASVG